MATSQKKLAAVDWTQVRAEYEAGASYATLALKYRRSKAALSKHGRKEGWVQDAEAGIRRQLADRSSGIGKVAERDPVAREKAIEAAVDKRFGIVQSHRDEWQAIRGLLYGAMKDARSKDAEVRSAASSQLKNLRAATAALTLTQSGERRAWNIPQDFGATAEDRRLEVHYVGDPYAMADAQQ